MKKKNNMECQGDDYKHYQPRFLTEWDVTIGGLATLAIQNKPKNEKPDVIVIFLHGYGSNTSRTKKIAEQVLNHCFLKPTSRFLQPHDIYIPTVLFLIPQAPYEMEGCNVFYWWDIPNIGLPFAFMLTGSERLEDYYPEVELSELRRLFHNYFIEVEELYGETRLIIGGFSQGSLLATNIMLMKSYYRKPEMLILMSSTLIAKAAWHERRKECNETGEPMFDTYVLQTHGIKDIVLHYDAGKKLFGTLYANNAGTTEFYSFEGGHDMSVSAREHVAIQIRNLVFPKTDGKC